MTEAKSILLDLDLNCDAGRSLRKVIEALADANLQEADEDDSDAAYARRSEAETLLFQLASAFTKGKRWHDDGP